MVQRARSGVSLREVAAEFGVSHPTVLRWLTRARGLRLASVDWRDRPPGARSAHRVEEAVEDRILAVRRDLRTTSDLGEYGAHAIRAALIAQGVDRPPSVRTIGRVLVRRGALGEPARVRRPAPPRGWYLPDAARGLAEIDSFDVVEGLRLEGGHWVEVLTGVSVFGGLPAAWPMELVTSDAVIASLLEHWREVGLPDFVQFDNDMRFYGSHRPRPGALLGRVPRLCLRLGVDVVFAPPYEQGFQGAVESFNGMWQSKVWSRFHHSSREELRGRSDRYVGALRRRRAARIHLAPARRELPARAAARPSAGRVVLIRRTTESGELRALGHDFKPGPQWPGRLVRVEFDVGRGRVEIFALRRAAPHLQPLLLAEDFDVARLGLERDVEVVRRR